MLLWARWRREEIQKRRVSRDEERSREERREYITVWGDEYKYHSFMTNELHARAYTHTHTRVRVLVRRGGESRVTTKYCRWEYMWEEDDEIPQDSVPHPRHIWCFRVLLSVKPSFKYSVYIQLTLDKKPLQIIPSVCFTVLGQPEDWHLWYQPYSDVPYVVTHRHV